MSIDIKNALHAQAQLQQMSKSRDTATVRADAGAARAAEKPGLADRVTLSAAAQQLARAAEIHTSEPVVNSQRIVDIRQALHDGSYTVDTTRVAEKIRIINARLH